MLPSGTAGCSQGVEIMLDRFQTIGCQRTLGRVTPRTHSLCLVLVVLCLVLSPGGLSADTDRAYSRGKKAAGEEQWRLAAQLMVQAIDADPVETKRPLLGPYIPHYFLGLSLYELGDCEVAMQHLQMSRRYRVVRDIKQLRKLDEIENSCESRSEMLQQVRREIESAHQLAARLETSTVDPLLTEFWTRGLPPPIVQFREARLSLGRAEQLLETETDLEISAFRALQLRISREEQISNSSLMTAQVVDLLQHLEKAAEQDAEESGSARQTLLDEVLELRLQVVRAWSSASIPVSGSFGERDLKARYDRVARLYLGDGGVTVDELRDAKVQLSDFLDDLEDLPPRRQQRHRTPTPLHQAAEAYFAGRYDQVLALLENVTLAGRQAQAHLYLFRAAALYSLYLIGDQPDPDLLSAAQANVESCLQSDASLEPLEEAFSPRFVQFFRERSFLQETTAMVARVPGGTRGPGSK